MQLWNALHSQLSAPSSSSQGQQPVEHSASSLPIRILTHNIRYAASDLFPNEKPWPERCPLILSQLKHETRFLDGPSHAQPPIAGTAFICLQEVLHTQLVNILDGLNALESSKNPTSSDPAHGPTWAHVGVGRDDGNQKGEYSPILYPIKVYELLYNKTVWLSPTPDTPSLGWDAGSIRILTLAVFRHKATGRCLVSCNTHLDNTGSVSREKSVGIILDTINRVRKEWAGQSSKKAENKESLLPVFLAGDFNSFPTQEAYLAMQSSGLMCDLRDMVRSIERYGNDITFTAFRPDQDVDEHGRIDFLWLGPEEAVYGIQYEDESEEGPCKKNKIDKCVWRVEGYAVLPNVFEEGIYSSDHRCVVGDVVLI